MNHFTQFTLQLPGSSWYHLRGRGATKKILIITDKTNSVQSLSRALTDSGIRTVTAAHATEAEEALRRDPGTSYVLVEDESCAKPEESAERVTVRKDALDRLHRYEQIVENAEELVSETDEHGYFTFVNRRHEEVLGYSAEELIGTSAAALLHPDDLQKALQKHDTIREEERSSVDRWRFRCKDGSYRSFECRGTVYTDHRGRKLTVVISHDITEQEETREALQNSEQRFASFMDHLPGAAFIKDRDNRILFCNQMYASMIGSSPEELLSQHMEEQVPPELQQQYRRENLQVTEQGESLSSESSFPYEGKSTHWLTKKFPIYSETDTHIGAISMDITSLKETEQRLSAAVEDRERLLKELNHRVKNNFLMINSLLSIKESTNGDDFSDIRARIDAIRIVHEKLYYGDSVGEVYFAEYCGDLLRHIFSSSPIRPVRLEESYCEATFQADTAITLGLIANEIAVNAMKYGFRSGEEAVFCVELREEGDEHVLVFSNSGAPFPGDIEPAQTGSMGLKLVSALVEKLDGTLLLQKTPHTEFSIRFRSR